MTRLSPTLTLDAAPQASNTPPRRAPGVVANLDLGRPASGIAALLTGSGSREPAPVKPCRRPRCQAPATTTGDCVAHRLQIQYDADEESL